MNFQFHPQGKPEPNQWFGFNAKDLATAQAMAELYHPGAVLVAPERVQAWVDRINAKALEGSAHDYLDPVG